MERYHPQLELAPRDVVARAIAREGMSPDPAETWPVYLDMRHVTEIDLVERFPGISRFLAGLGLSLRHDQIPVRPAAHYLMGGVRTDLDGRTTLKGLYAAGEVACTGVHGANRLASNSLLEGLVFGARAAKAILADGLTAPGSVSELVVSGERAMSPENADNVQLSQMVTELRAAMFRCAGLLRDEASLQEGFAALEPLTGYLEESAQAEPTRERFEAQALVSVSRSILSAALARTESRGAHYRNDFPKRDDRDFLKHSIQRDGKVRFEAW
jgi:L-aspartate oxidase